MLITRNEEENTLVFLLLRFPYWLYFGFIATCVPWNLILNPKLNFYIATFFDMLRLCCICHVSTIFDFDGFFQFLHLNLCAPDVNWTYIRLSEDTRDFLCTFNLRVVPMGEGGMDWTRNPEHLNLDQHLRSWSSKQAKRRYGCFQRVSSKIHYILRA